MLGAPGSGKGTQGKLLADNLGYGYFSMGAVLRQVAASDSPQAKQIKELIDSGRIIPDELIQKIFQDQLNKFKEHESVVIDAFPRDIDQVNILNDAVKEHQVNSLRVIFLDVPKEVLLERIKERNEEAREKRADDRTSVIDTRFAEYEAKTLPLVDYFQKAGILIRIMGNRPIEEVHQEILEKVHHASWVS